MPSQPPKSPPVADLAAARLSLSRKKKLLFSMLCIAAGWVLACYGLELYDRLVLPSLPLDGVHDGVHYTWGHPVRYNRAAFREREFVMPKPPGTFRVVVLGDSLTWGAGLAEADRYTNQLEARLRRAFPDRSIEVLNFGFSGEATPTLRAWWQTIKDTIEADLLIVGFCINDTQPLGQDYCVERERFAPLFDAILALKSIGLVHGSDRTKAMAETTLDALGLMPRWPEALDRTYRKDSAEWRAFEAALQDIHDMTAALNLPPPILALLNQGVSRTEPTDYDNPGDVLELYFRWYGQVRETAEVIGFTVVSFEDLFAERLSDRVLAVNYRDGHPTAACNAIYAERLAEVVSPIISTWQADAEQGE